MTDGIIKQAFTKALNNHFDYFDRTELKQLEQELTASIKQDIQTLWLEFDCDSRTARKILQHLIGDNQK